MTAEPTGSDGAQRELNTSVWSRGGFVRNYRAQALRPAEEVLFSRHAQALSGAVLELGCGGGRITGHLLERASSLRAMDIAADMVERCRALYPGATFEVADIRDLSRFPTASADAIVAGFNLIDVLDDDERGVFLDSVHRILSRDGVLIFSSHNLACVPLVKGPLGSLSLNPIRTANRLLRLPRSLRNRRRLAPLQRFEADYAIVNDVAHDHSLLHYYIGRDGQERQLAGHGFELLECVDLEGHTVERGETAFGCHELHYAARRVDRPLGDEHQQAAERVAS
jgi:SAM-dependent methyltransferase